VKKCWPGDSLGFSDISTFRACGNVSMVFNFLNWMGNSSAVGNTTSYSLSVNKGVVTSTQHGGSIY